MHIRPHVEAVLAAAIGFDSASIGVACVERAVRERMAAQALHDEARYLELLTASDQEREALIEQIVVPETWFFRDDHPFRVVRRYVLDEWLPRGRNTPLRLLSLPCATGEEPYSLAMTLLDCGLRPAQWRMDAVDVSQVALAKARRAVYGKNSFRGTDLSFRDRYFHPTPDGYALDEVVRRAVTFTPGNLFDPDRVRARDSYDLIFFRNLLIYFNRERQEQALAVMERLLAPTGLLFVGHAEAGSLLDRWFASARYPRAFAYRKRADDRRMTTGSAAPERRDRPADQTTPTFRATPPAAPRPRISPPAAPTVSPLNPLAAARALADRGQWDAARQQCEAALRIPDDQASAYALLGLIHDATQHPAAAEACFHKAVYLEPNHAEALLHLALAAERRGDRETAQRFRHRAQRADERRRQEVP